MIEYSRLVIVVEIPFKEYICHLLYIYIYIVLICHIVVADKGWSPNPVNVKVGDTITWTNEDSQAHTVTSGKDSSDPDLGKVFDSSPNFNPLLAPKQTFQHKFTTAGEVPYFCQLHPTMIGKVVVS
jgi:plastocyanin